MVVFRRGLHVVPKLANFKEFSSLGIEGLYSAAGFQTAWTNYQRYLTTQLSISTVGTENEVRTPYQILLKTAKQTTQQHIFHYASQAHNNHFFFQQLAPKSQAQSSRPMRQLMEKLSHQGIASKDVLKERMIQAALLDPAPGWVFLVENANKNLEVMRCNVDGTPYYYGKNQSIDLNGGIDDASFDKLEATEAKAAALEKDWNLPLLALSTWDHAFVEDFGINGKEEYLQKVWECINWDVVNKRLFVV